MNISRLHIAFVMALAFAIAAPVCSHAQTAPVNILSESENELPIVERGGKQYFKYTVKKGDSVYGICHRNGWDQNLLRQTNPRVTSDLKKGGNLYYPVAATATDGTYLVRRGDTVYSIAEAHGMSVDEIYAATPSARHGIQEGEIIRLKPAENAPESVPMVKKADSKPMNEQRVADYMPHGYQIQTEPTSAKHLPNSNFAENTADEEVAVDSEKVASETNDVMADEVTNNNIKEEETNDVGSIVEEVDDTLDITLLLEQPKSNRDLEFTRGVLVALENAKKSGCKINLNVLDVTDSIGYDLPQIETADVLVSTGEKDFPAQLLRYADKTGKKLINVFNVKGEQYTTHPSVMQMMTPTQYFNSAIANYLATRFQGWDVITLGTPEENDLMADVIVEAMNANPVNFSYNEMEQYEPIDGTKTLIYCFSTKKADITRALELIESKKSSNEFAEIELVGRPNWVVYAEEMSDKMNAAEAWIPSRFWFDESSAAGRNFINTFNRTFGHEPLKSFPNYAAEGFDVANWILATMGDVRMVKPLLCDIKLEDPDGKGNVNTASILVHFTPYGITEKLVVK